MTTRERDLIERLARVARAFAAPNPDHLALRSQYSRLGVCTLTRGRHTDACLAWREVLADAVAYLDEQPALLGAEGAGQHRAGRAAS